MSGRFDLSAVLAAMVKVGLEPPDESTTNLSTSAQTVEQAVRNPVQSSDPDPMAAFLASLTADQKAKLAALLLGGTGG